MTAWEATFLALNRGARWSMRRNLRGHDKDETRERMFTCIIQRSIRWWDGKTRKNPIALIWNSTFDLLFLVRRYQHLKREREAIQS